MFILAEERALDLKEKELWTIAGGCHVATPSHQEREAALEKERLMAVKYKDRQTNGDSHTEFGFLSSEQDVPVVYQDSGGNSPEQQASTIHCTSFQHSFHRMISVLM